jgi:hypothetical protein
VSSCCRVFACRWSFVFRALFDFTYETELYPCLEPWIRARCNAIGMSFQSNMMELEDVGARESGGQRMDVGLQCGVGGPRVGYIWCIL